MKKPSAVRFISRSQYPNTHPPMQQVGGFHKCRIPKIGPGDPYRIWDDRLPKNVQRRCPVCGKDFVGKLTRKVCSRACARTLGLRLQQERLTIKKGERA